jgi:hypothetical protein
VRFFLKNKQTKNPFKSPKSIYNNSKDHMILRVFWKILPRRVGDTEDICMPLP